MDGPPARSLASRPARDLPRMLALVAVCAAAMAVSLATGGGHLDGLAAAALVPVVAAIAVSDARAYLIPDTLNAAALALGLMHAAAVADVPFEGILAALARGGVLALLFLALRLGYRALRGRDGLGLGDVKLAAVAGVWLEVPAIPLAIEIAALSALLAYAIRHGLRRRRGRAPSLRHARLPFGLFFAPAIWIGWLLGHWLLSGW